MWTWLHCLKIRHKQKQQTWVVKTRSDKCERGRRIRGDGFPDKNPFVPPYD